MNPQLNWGFIRRKRCNFGLAALLMESQPSHDRRPSRPIAPVLEDARVSPPNRPYLGQFAVVHALDGSYPRKYVHHARMSHSEASWAPLAPGGGALLWAQTSVGVMSCGSS